MILLVDSHDSFVWNIVQALETLGAAVRVVRNDAIGVEEALASRPAAIVLGPGPGRPAQAGILPELLARAGDELPILGICLGHQALVEACGGAIERDPRPAHGWSSPVLHDGDELFSGVPNPFEAGRYHSLRARRAALPPTLRVTAWTADGSVMAVRHIRLPRFGVQFHPDSILTPAGGRIFANFLVQAGVPRREPAEPAILERDPPREDTLIR